MKDTLVIYKSKSGFTKQYAQWIAEELDADLREQADTKAQDMLPYKAIVYGGGLYAVGINGISLLKDNYDKLRDKRVAVFACGASPGRPEDLDAIQKHNFTPAMQGSARFFYFRGGFDFSKLGVKDKILMTLLRKKIEGKKSEELTDDERGMLSLYGSPMDYTKREEIAPLVQYIRSGLGEGK